VNVAAVHTAPVFDAFPVPVPVQIDETPQSVLLTVVARGSGSMTYSIGNVSPASAATFFAIGASTGAITSQAVPSAIGLSIGNYTLSLTASDGILSTTQTVLFEIRDNCYVAAGDEPLCVHGDCVNGFKTFTCNCYPPFGGDNCSSIPPVVTNAASSSSGLASGATAGIVIGIICGLLLVVVIAIVVVRRKQSKTSGKGLADFDTEAQAAVFNNGFMKEDTYDVPIHPSVDTDFQPGVANPMYAWYQPHMSRQECEEYLCSQGEGAFVIRDSSFTPGWHMLAVKTSNSIMHERIKLHADGTYEMLPSTNAHQPNFRGIPDLVDHYAACKRNGVHFALALDNPIYDNHLLQAAPRGVKALDTIFEVDAPVVPMREHEREQVAQLANEEQEMYTNTAEAKVLASAC